MKRSEFLKRLGLGIAAIPLAPQIVAATKEAFDGAGTDSLMNDEAGIWADEVPKEWLAKESIGFEGSEQFSHYEEPWVHNTKPWPLMLWDVILLPGDQTYVVTEVRYGSAVLTPHDGRLPNITVHKGDEMIRIPNAANFNT